MALKFPVELPVGITIDYWRVDQIMYDYNAKPPQIQVHLSCYVSEAARKAGANATEVGDIITFPMPDDGSIPDIRAAIYDRIKAIKKYETATDI